GAAWPAWQAARMSVVRALASRAAPPRRRTLMLVSAAGAAGVLIQLSIVLIPTDAQTVFWAYATLGLPAMFIGYFLLSVPLALLLARLLGPALTRLHRLPPSLLGPTIRQTPYRHGFTSGAMMVGLAMMVEIWSVGGAFLRDWLTKVEFPDAFVSGLALPPEARDTIESLEFVERTSVISQHIIEVDAFGVQALQRYTSWFFAFEPDSFFDMAEITFVDGDAETARRRLNEGGAVIVAREFQIAKGLGAGDDFTFTHEGEEHTLEIVGVVTSPGLELASKFFNIGEDFTNQAIHAVFGSRGDAKRLFNADAVQLIQVDLTEDIDDAEAVQRLREAVFGLGVLDVGSGRMIKDQLRVFVHGMLLVFSSVAIGAMLVACLGVANLIIAGIEARRFEFGVLRSVGAGRALLVRLIAGEAVIIALGAAILGSLMGLQGSLAAMRLYAMLLGIEFTPRPPFAALAIGWGVVLLITLAAATPAILRLNRRRPLELLASISG
ncbi:MAG: ABC transporter permease, partial [Phycisphaerales bacterium JB059]